MKSLKPLFAKTLISMVLIVSFHEKNCSDIEPKAFIYEEVEAWHFHVYFFEVDALEVSEMLTFRKTLRENIDDGTFPECSLNQVYVGWNGPHPISQFEMCCNKSSFAVAHSYHTQNHGNLSVLIHPLTTENGLDHSDRASWLGKAIKLWTHYPFAPLIKPLICPVYPYYPDQLPTKKSDYFVPVPGTEDYKGLNKEFIIFKDPY